MDAAGTCDRLAVSGNLAKLKAQGTWMQYDLNDSLEVIEYSLKQQ